MTQKQRVFQQDFLLHLCSLGHRGVVAKMIRTEKIYMTLQLIYKNM